MAKVKNIKYKIVSNIFAIYLILLFPYEIYVLVALLNV